jgi:hypothetical protein
LHSQQGAATSSRVCLRPGVVGTYANIIDDGLKREELFQGDQGEFDFSQLALKWLSVSA